MTQGPRKISMLRAYEAAALGAPEGIITPVTTGDVHAPASQISKIFTIQSYLDSTYLERAILTQSPNNPIVPSTMVPVDMKGYAVALHPSSETPVAVEFKAAVSGGGQAASSTIILKPGQIIRPHGRPDSASGAFAGFKWGLPFGWLGGGLATLLVFPTPDSTVSWTEQQREVLFHRARFQIVAPASVPTVATARRNWPFRFPWLTAYFQATTAPQQGKAQLKVQPTRALMRLRLSSATGIAAPATMRILYVGMDDLDLDGTNALDTSYASFTNVVWGTYANPAGLANITTTYPLVEVTGAAIRPGGDGTGVSGNGGIVVFVDMDDGDDLAGQYVDVFRYGTL